MATPHRCFISVAGNLDPETAIPRALDQLHTLYPLTGISTFFRTEPINRPEQPSYLNGVVSLFFDAHPRVLKYDILRPIEQAVGRVRTADAYAARPIDLDVVWYGDLWIDEPGLKLPDPDLRERVFLVAALLELAPDLKFPGTGELLRSLFSEEEINSLVPDKAFAQFLKERYLSEH